MRVESHKSMEKGGWLHRLTDPLPYVPPSSTMVHKTYAECKSLADEMFRHELAPAMRRMLSESLHVSVESLVRLQVGYGMDSNNREFASFPCRDEFGMVIGITRRYTNGRKLTLAGTSNSGVFAIMNWWESNGPVFIVEGPTDTAVLVGFGLCCIGKPSNVSGILRIGRMLQRRGSWRTVVVFGENDRKFDRIGDVKHGCQPTCDGCPWCWPGKFGMQRTVSVLKDALDAPPVGIMPPTAFKDIRDWASKSPNFLGDLHSRCRSYGVHVLFNKGRIHAG